MYTVVLCGNRQTDALLKNLDTFADILLRPAVPGSALAGDIAIYTHPQGIKNLQLHCRVGIAPADAPRALQFFKTQNIPVLTVGRAGRDTLTLSSRQETSAVVSLQREICTLTGESIGPADYPIAIPHPCSDRALLYTVAVLLLCGKEKLLLHGRPLAQSSLAAGLCKSMSDASN